MKNSVTINLKKENILIKINEEAEYKEIIECLKEKIEGLRKLYKDEKTPILVTGKILQNEEMKEIKAIIKNEIDVEIDFDSPSELGLHGIKRTYSKKIETSETKFYKGSLRSGQKLEFEGSIVVIGDVNGGAEIVAGENIAVLGALRGIAHAGAKGNKEAIITARTIDVPKIRIANIIKEMEGEKGTYAYVQGENIILE